MTPFLLLGSLIIWRYNGWVKSLHWTANYQITPSSNKIWYSCSLKSFALKSQFIRTAAPLSILLKISNHKGRFLFTFMQNSSHIRHTEICFGLKGKIWPLAKLTPKGAQPLPILLLRHHHLTIQCVTSMIILSSQGKIWTETWFARNIKVTTTVS